MPKLTIDDVEECIGLESIALNGKVVDKTSAEIELLYLLTVEDKADSECVEFLGSATYRIFASGTMTALD